MSLINTYINISRAVRAFIRKAKAHLVKKLQGELDLINTQLAEVEARRSDNMISLHQAHYAELERLANEKEEAWLRICNEHARKLADECSDFVERKASIAVTSQAIADDLKARRVAVSSELDNLVG